MPEPDETPVAAEDGGRRKAELAKKGKRTPRRKRPPRPPVRKDDFGQAPEALRPVIRRYVGTPTRAAVFENFFGTAALRVIMRSPAADSW